MLLEAKNVVKKYAEQLALDSVNVSVPENSIYGLLGPNGAGKTTLIRIINCITAPDSGEIFFKGKSLNPNNVKDIGYLPEERGLYKKMKVGEQILYLARLKGLSKHDAQLRAKYWFEKFEIQAWWNKKVEELSKGMQQKVQFISTVLHEPELLIFDEPFSGFDPLNADLMKKEILDMKQKGATIIFSTHNMQSVEELCDNISLIHKSKVVLEGNVTEIRERYKQHVFRLKTRDENINIADNDFFEVISTHQKSGMSEIRIKSKFEIENNQLIQQILPYCHIISFEEELPSMNEVFISTVQQQ